MKNNFLSLGIIASVVGMTYNSIVREICPLIYFSTMLICLILINREGREG